MNVLTQMTPGSRKSLLNTGFVQALALCTLLMFTAIFTSTSARAEPESLGTYKDWIAYSLNEDDGNQICYIVSEPTEKLPRNVNHGNVYMVISDWPNRNTTNEPSLLVGYDLKENSAVTAQIGGEKWEMFTYEQGAWIQETSDEKNLIAAMRRGSSMSLKATSKRGTATEYKVSLSGISAALDRLAAACK